MEAFTIRHDYFSFMEAPEPEESPNVVPSHANSENAFAFRDGDVAPAVESQSSPTSNAAADSFAEADSGNAKTSSAKLGTDPESADSMD